MSKEELTKSCIVKRNSKKKSGYTVSVDDGVYYLENAPSRARVNPGDQIVGINGIPSDEFLDEDDANDLIESIRIVVVPKDKLDEYDGIQKDDDDDDDEEEDYEEYDRSRKKPQSNQAAALAPAAMALAPAAAKNMPVEAKEDEEPLVSYERVFIIRFGLI
jgi:predicted metalloprotease with PDZ domain